MSHISLKRTAYHEAGHAVMALWLRCRFRHVSIIPNEDEGSLGHILRGKGAKVEPEPMEPSRNTQFQLERLALVSLAGSAAECLLTGHNYKSGSQTDFSDTYNYINRLTNDEDEIRAYINWLRVRARVILKISWNWFAVEVLAKELLKRKYIGGRQVHQIIRKAWKDSCPA